MMFPLLTTLLSIYIFAIGVYLLRKILIINNKFISCMDQPISNSINILLILSTAMIVSSMGLFVCFLFMKCPTAAPRFYISNASIYFITFNSILSILLISIGIYLNVHMKKSDCSSKLKKQIYNVYLFGLVLLLPLFLYIIYIIYRRRVRQRMLQPRPIQQPHIPHPQPQPRPNIPPPQPRPNIPPPQPPQPPQPQSKPRQSVQIELPSRVPM